MGTLAQQAEALRRQVTRYVARRVSLPDYDSLAADMDLGLANLVARLARMVEAGNPPSVPESYFTEPLAEDLTLESPAVEELAQVLFAQIIGSPKQWAHAIEDNKKRWRELALTALTWRQDQQVLGLLKGRI
jgi:hypothetical protein